MPPGAQQRQQPGINFRHRIGVLVQGQYSQIAGILGILLYLPQLPIIPVTAGFVLPFAIQQIGVGRRGENQGHRVGLQIAAYLPGIVRHRYLLGFPRQPQPRLGQLHITLLQIEAHSIPVDILRRHQRSAAAHERVQRQFASMGKQFNHFSRQRNGECRRMDFLVPDVAPLIIELPHPQLAFNPLFGGQTVEMIGLAVASPRVADGQNLPRRDNRLLLYRAAGRLYQGHHKLLELSRTDVRFTAAY